MKRKALSIITAVLMSVIFLTGCCGNDMITIAESDYISKRPLPLSGICLEVEPDSLSVYKNIAFILSEGSIIRLDLLTGDTSIVLEDTTAIAVGCDGSRIAVIAPYILSVYDYDGNRITEIPLEAEVSNIASIAVGGNAIVFADCSKPSNIYYADIKTDKVTLLPDTWKLGAKDASVQKLSLSTDGTLSISNEFNYNFAGYDFRVLEYDIDGDEVFSSSNASVSAYNGCFDTDGEFYYVENYISGFGTDTAWNQFVSKISRDGTFSNVMLIDNAGLRNIGIEPQNIYIDSDTDAGGNYEYIRVLDEYSLEYADSKSFVIWNQTAGTLSAFNSDSNLDALVLLVPDTSSWLLKELIIEYTAQTGRQVVMISYSHEEYADRLRTKLLASDSDFDLFISDAMLLNSILENTAYQPLDAYENLTANFDNVLAEGVLELMTAEGGLFGVPMSINFWGCLKQTGDYDVPQDWTTEELFELCEKIPVGKKVFRDRFMLTRTVINYIEDMISKDGGIDKEELSDFFGKLKGYNDRGALCDGESNPILIYGTVFFSAFNLKVNNVENSVINIAPTRSGTKYLELEKTMIMNRSSKNKEAAAEFLAMMTSDYIIYNNDDFGLLIGRDVKRNSCYMGLTDSQKEILEYSMSMYQNSKHSKFEVAGSFPQFIAYDVVEFLFNGEMTPDEAAQKVIDEVAYTYFE